MGAWLDAAEAAAADAAAATVVAAATVGAAAYIFVGDSARGDLNGPG